MGLAHHPVQLACFGVQSRGYRIALSCLRILQHAVLHMGQGLMDHGGRHGDTLLQAYAILPMPHAQQRHEGEGDVSTNALRGPVEHRPHAQVVLGAPEGLLDLSQAPVLIQDGGVPGGVRKVGDDPVPAFPAGIGDDGLGIDLDRGGAGHLQEATVFGVAQQSLRRRHLAMPRSRSC